MGGGFGRAMEAAAIGIGAAMQGFGEGTMKDYMIKREEYMDSLKEQRMAQMAAQDRAYRSEEAEKGRGFEKEMFGEKMGWDKEKFGMEQAAEEKQFERQSALQLKLAGMRGGGGKETPAEIQKVKYLAGLLAKAEGVDSPTQAHELAAFNQLNKESGRAASIPDAIEISERRAELRSQAEQGNKDAERQLKELEALTNKGGADTAAKDTYSDVVAELKNISDPTNTADAKLRGEPPEVQMEVATGRVTSRRQAFGLPVPGMSQESKTGAPQPQGVEAPATSTKGDKPTNATPPGQGSEASPLMVTTEEQKAWVMQNSPKGAWIAYNGKLFQK